MTSLRIHRWQNEYRVPRDHPAPSMLGGDLDRLAQRLADTLADHLDTLLAGNGDGVVLLPALEIDCHIDTASPPDQIVRHWSQQLALAFARALDDPVSGVVRLPSRAAYHARYIGELLRGRGRDGWLYRRFEGLHALPASAAIRTLLTEDTGTGRATLALIDEPSWPLLLSTLTDREAVRILSQWLTQEGSRGDGQPLRAPLAVWARASLATPGRVAPPLIALWLLAHASRASDDTADIATACWLATLFSMPDDVPPRTLRRIARDADLGALAGLAASVRDPDWLLLLGCAPGAARKAAARLAAESAAVATHRHDAAQAASEDAVPERLDAPFAGLAWLLPALQDLLDAALLAALPPVPAPAGTGDSVDTQDVVALLTLAFASCSHGEQVWRDPFWRTFLRLPPRFDTRELHDWLASHDPANARSALADSLQRRALTGAVRVRFVLHGAPVEWVVERGSGCRLHSGAPRARPEAGPLTFVERLTLTRLLRQDGALLAASPVRAALPPDWRDIFETLAQATLRRTGFRIPGAACSSLPYLFANVLGSRGEARCAGVPPASAWTLELGRPPLHVLLSLNGMARLQLRWPASRSLSLHCVE